MRLLNIATGRIERFDLPSDAPPYAAISYVWPVDPSFKWTSTPNLASRIVPSMVQKERTPSAPATVPFASEWPIPSCDPETLNKALTAIYQDGQHVLDESAANHHPISAPHFTHLWMDVLCLNQIDEKDKAEDVKHMKDFYSNAVCVWVFLDKLGEPDMPVTADGPARWFTRLWTLQECILPQKLYFYLSVSKTGHPVDLLTAQWVSRAHMTCYIAVCCGLASNAIAKPKDHTQAFNWGLQLLALGISKPSIRIALLLSSVRQCRYDVDRLYGILGMLPKDKDLFDVDKLVMDYSQGYDVVSESFAQALGPATLENFGFFCSSPPEMKAPNLKVSSKLGWFGNFEPGFYMSGSTSHAVRQNALIKFMTEDTICLSDSVEYMAELNRPRDQKFSYPSISHLTNQNVYEGILLEGTRVTTVTNMTDEGFNKILLTMASTDKPGDKFMETIMGTAMALVHAKDKHFKWAFEERRKFLARLGRSVNMPEMEEKKWEEKFGCEFRGKRDDGVDKLSDVAGTSATSKNNKLKIGWQSKLEDHVIAGMERFGQMAGVNSNNIFLFPPYMRDVNITTLEGNKMSGFGTYVDMTKPEVAGRLVMLFVTRTDSGDITSEYGNPGQTDMHILGYVVQEACLAQGKKLVVRKIGVVHVYKYFSDVNSHGAVAGSDFEHTNAMIV